MKKCLVVDDSEVVREISVRIVEALGLSAKQAPNAAEAVDCIREWQPEVVLLDWDLPSMGALDFLRGVGELPEADRPEIVLCATENDAQQFTLAKAAGAGHHILKPFTQDIIAVKFAELGLCEAPSFSASSAG